MTRKGYKTVGLIMMMAMITLLLSSCVEQLVDDVKLTIEITGYNQDALDLIEEGKYEEAIVILNKALSVATREGMKDATYNNLSYAYQELEEFDLALEYIDKALEIMPNDEYEYTNKGNVLFALDRPEEAQEFYELALKENKHTAYAHYGLGIIYYEAENYEDAIAAFDKYLTYEAFDQDGMNYKIHSHLLSGDERAARQYAEHIMQETEQSYAAYEIMETVLDWIGDYEELKQLYEDMAMQFPDQIDALMKMGQLDYYYGKYKQSLDYFIDLLESYPDHLDLYTWIIYNYSALEQIESALTYYEKALAVDDSSSELHMAIGDLYSNHTYYMEAIPFYELAIEHAPEDETSYNDKLQALFYGKRYSKCTDFGHEIADLFPYSSRLLWQVADCYYQLEQFEEAISWYEKALQHDPHNDFILSDIGYSYLSLGDYDQAYIYSEKSLAEYDGNYDALHIQSVIEQEKEPIGQRVREFFQDSYLYFNSSNSSLLASSFNKDQMSNAEIAAAIEKVKDPNDLFTTVLYGPDYDAFVSFGDLEVHHEVYGSQVHYLRINSFNTNTDTKVIEILDDIDDPEQKVLVIDLRGNTGGLTSTANNILDILLGDVVTSSLILRDGYTYPYYSDASQITFKNIAVLVDEWTASAAELLTLGLKTYLDQTVIIGRHTYGKGVGQILFEDRAQKIIVLVTNHYWNVRQKNIMDANITPDIYVEGNDLDSFLNALPFE